MEKFITHEITAENLVKRALMNMKGNRQKHPRWAIVANNFGVGRTAAHEICEYFDFDPDEVLKK